MAVSTDMIDQLVIDIQKDHDDDVLKLYKAIYIARLNAIKAQIITEETP